MAGTWSFLGTLFDHGEAPGASPGPKSQKVPWFLAIFGSPWRPKNRLKIDPWLKKRSQGSFLNAFLSRMRFYSLWGSIFHRFFMKNRCNNWCIFSRQHVFFSSWQTLNFVDRRDGLSTFYFFHVFEIYEKTDQKTEQNRYPQKTSKKWSWGSQNGPKMAQNWSENCRKSQKRPPKHENWRIDFLMIFWIAKKLVPKSYYYRKPIPGF